MKKRFINRRFLSKIVKISLSQIALLLIFSSITLAMPVKAQEILDTKISLALKNVSLETSLDELEKIAQVKFSYNSRALNLDQKVTVIANKEALSRVLDRILQPLNIQYFQVSNRIVLRNSSDQSKVENSGNASLILNKGIADITVKGIVTDEKGERLPGVNILIKGTTRGISTNNNGEFSIDLPNDKSSLAFSFVGFKSQEVVVGNRTQLNIILIQDSKSLAEVVVIGYGTQEKVNLTGSVSTVKFETLVNRPSPNAVNALAGAVPGMTIVQGGGQPGNDVGKVNIRGIGSLNANSSPLVIIDGVNSDLSFFSTLSPQEIESVSVLKDAASAAIYGSRAANGVILVTTKSGMTDKTKISFNSYYGLQQATVLPKLLDSWDNAKLENEARINAKQPIFWTDQMIELMKNNDPSDHFHNTDWVEEGFKTSPVQNYDLSVSSGTGKLKVYSNFNYYNQEGIVNNSNSDRVSLRNKFDLQINNHIKLGLNISGILKNLHRPADEQFFSQTLGRTNAIAPKYYNNGDYFVRWDEVPSYQTTFTPTRISNYGYFNSINKKLMSSLTAEVNWKDIKFNSLVSYNYDNIVDKRWRPLQTIKSDAGTTVFTTDFARLNQNLTNSESVQVENYLNYAPKIGDKHSLSLLAGHTFLSSKISYFGAYGEKFSNNTTQVLTASSTANQRAYGSENEFSLQSYFGRLNYSFKDKYLVEANVRYDGSSRFAKDNRYGLFPSFSAGWRISEENFLKNSKSVNNLKLRASWGMLGNQDIGSNYPYSSVFSTSEGYLINGLIENGAAITTLSNDEVTWEKTSTSNVGIDATFFNHLDLSLEYFIRNSFDMLVVLPVPLTLGSVNPPFQNIGKVENKGWELSGMYRGSSNKFNYSLNFNVSNIKNQVIDIGKQRFLFAGDRQVIREGNSINSWFGYIFDGIYQSQQEIIDGPKRAEPVAPGDLKYKDISGINGTPDGKIDSYDRTTLANSFPEITYGFGTNLSYNNIDLNLFFQGVGNVGIESYSFVNHAGRGVNPMNWTVEWLNRWTPENPSQEFPRLHYLNTYNDRSMSSSYWIEDGSFLRLRNLELGYSFKSNLLKKLRVEKLRIYVGGQNFLTFTKMKHFDPERAYNLRTNDFYPQIKTYQLGLNVTF